MALVHDPRLRRYRGQPALLRPQLAIRKHATGIRGPWRAFDRWCATQGRQILPDEPTVSQPTWSPRAGPGRSSNPQRQLAAIVFAPQAAGRPFDRHTPIWRWCWPASDASTVLARAASRAAHRCSCASGACGLGRHTVDARGALLAVLYTAALRARKPQLWIGMQAGSGRGWLGIGPKHLEIVIWAARRPPGGRARAHTDACEPAHIASHQRWVRHAAIRPGEPLLRPLTRTRPGSTRPTAGAASARMCSVSCART